MKIPKWLKTRYRIKQEADLRFWTDLRKALDRKIAEEEDHRTTSNSPGDIGLPKFEATPGAWEK